LDEVQRRVPVLAQVQVLQLVREQVSQLALALVLEQLLALQVAQPIHCDRCSRVRLRE
jgi:hypothetical protein